MKDRNFKIEVSKSWKNQNHSPSKIVLTEYDGAGNEQLTEAEKEATFN